MRFWRIGVFWHFKACFSSIAYKYPLTISSGPEAASYLQGLTSFNLSQLTFGNSAFVPIEGFNLHVARGGYTGEDGFEVSHSIFFFGLQH